MSIRHISLAILFLACTALAFALTAVPKAAARELGQKESPEVSNRVFNLGEIEVIAQREEAHSNTTLQKIYADELRLFDRNDLADAVNLLPGVILSQAGARNETMVYVRGFDMKHVPIFLDGIPIYVPYDGYPDLGRFSTFDLSQITLAKGFSSVLYGPNTMGGAINMVSRRPLKEFEFDGGAGYASGKTWHSYANLGSNQGKWYIQGGGAYTDSDYFRVSDDFGATPVQKTGKRVNSSRTDWRGNLKIGLTPNATDEYALSYIRQEGEKGTPPYSGIDPGTPTRWWKWPQWDKESFYFNSHTAIRDLTYVKSRLFYDTFENTLDDYSNDSFSRRKSRSRYDDYTYGGSIEVGSRLLQRNLVKLAVHYKEDVHRDITDNGDPVKHFKDRIFSIGVEDTIDLTDKFYAIAAIGYDRVETVRAEDLDKNKEITDFPHGTTEAWNPQLGLFYKVTDTDTLHAAVSRKSRLPYIKDKFSYRLGRALPNPDLEPEKALNYEVGYNGLLFDRFNLEMNIFYSHISDFILFKTVPDPNDPTKTLNQNHNIGKIEQYGAEVGLSGRILDSLQAGINYTYIGYRNRSTEDKLLNIPHHKGFGYLRYLTPLDGLSLLASVERNSSRYSSSDGVRVASSYTLYNAKAIYEFTNGFSLEGGVNNITDRNYALDEGYPLSGRSYFINLRYTY